MVSLAGIACVVVCVLIFIAVAAARRPRHNPAASGGPRQEPALFLVPVPDGTWKTHIGSRGGCGS